MNKENLGSSSFEESPKSKPFENSITKAIEISDSIDETEYTPASVPNSGGDTPPDDEKGPVDFAEQNNSFEQVKGDDDIERRIKMIEEHGVDNYEAVRQRLADQLEALQEQIESTKNQINLIDTEVSAMGAAIDAFQNKGRQNSHSAKASSSDDHKDLAGPYFSNHINADGTISAGSPAERAQESRDYLDRIGR